MQELAGAVAAQGSLFPDSLLATHAGSSLDFSCEDNLAVVEGSKSKHPPYD